MYNLSSRKERKLRTVFEKILFVLSAFFAAKFLPNLMTLVFFLVKKT